MQSGSKTGVINFTLIDFTYIYSVFFFFSSVNKGHWKSQSFGMGEQALGNIFNQRTRWRRANHWCLTQRQ